MSDLFICRHGNTFDPGDVVTRVGGRTDLPLSSSGQVQAMLLAEHFEKKGIRIHRAYCSPLRRTRATLDTILSKQISPPEVQTLGFLTELDYGPDENRPEAEVAARIGPDALNAWEERAHLPLGWKLDIRSLIASWRKFLMNQQRCDGVSMVMTSNGIARFVFPALGLDPAKQTADGQTIKLKTGAYGRLVSADSSVASPEPSVAGPWDIGSPSADLGYQIAEWNIRPV